MTLLPARATNFVTLSLRRARSDSLLLLALALGVIIAATALAGVVIYLRSLELVSVGSTVDSLGAARKNIQITQRRMAFTESAFTDRDAAIRTAVEANIPSLAIGMHHFIRSPAYFFGDVSDPAGVRRGPEETRALIHEMPGLSTQVRYVRGVPPGDRVRSDGATPVFEASVYEARAAEYGIEVGDVIQFEPVEGAGEPSRIVVTGIFQPIDLEAGYWMLLGQSMIAPSFDGQPPVIAFFVEEDPLWALALRSPGLAAEVYWFVETDRDFLARARAGSTLAAYDSFRQEVELRVPRSSVFGGLEPALRDLERRTLFARIPMFLIGALLLVLVTYYTLMVAGMLADRRNDDLAMLRTRGVSALQVVRLYALEGVAILFLAALVGPILARLSVSWLGYLEIYRPITGGQPLPTELSPAAFLWGGVAGVAAFSILLTPALLRARRAISEARRSAGRPTSSLWFQRFYVDAAVMVLGGLVLWELRSRRTIVTSGLSGEQGADVTMLFAPALLLIGVALLFLRAFPLLTRAASWSVKRGAPVWIVLALFRLSRSPFQYSWPVLLLVLASGLAVLAGALGSTLQQSTVDRSAYQTGADVHVSGISSSGAAESLTRVLQIDGVVNASMALRTSGNVGTTGRGQSFDLLAVDAELLGDMIWWRDDFAGDSPQALLQKLPVRVEPPPIEVPADATSLSIWAKADPPIAKLFLWAVLRDGNGRLHTLTFGPVSNTVWAQQSVALPDLYTPPLRLVSLVTYEPVSGDAGTPANLFLDDLIAHSGPGDDAPVTNILNFENQGLWTPLPTSQGFDVTMEMALEADGGTRVGPHAGMSVARLKLGRGTDGGVRGIYRSANAAPIPILAGDGFLAASGLAVGDRFVGSLSGTLTPLEIIGSVALFPTIDPSDGGFVLVDLPTLTAFSILRGATGGAGRNQEMFIDTVLDRPGSTLDAIRLAVGPGTQVADRKEIESASLIAPLTVAGWRGVGLVAAGATVFVVVVGLITYLASYLHRGRVETAYLRALGLARGGHLRAVALEQLSVVLLGLAIGIASGYGMTRMAVDSVSHTESGLPVLPPFVVVTDWTPVALVVGGLAVVALGTVAQLVTSYVRLPLHVLTRRAE